ncbi:MAG: DUF4492 domain-containing protein [Muribaculaceae bacterium]|nr:DUF4492 domain-containing protein [Muribaculaceae bacterium]
MDNRKKTAAEDGRGSENTPREGGERRPRGFFARVWDLYAGGFREMTVGRRLWLLILIKLAIIFLVFKLFFFPDRLREDYATDAERADAVRSALTNPGR